MQKIFLLICFWCCCSNAQMKDNNSLNLWENFDGFRVAGGYFENIELEASLLFTDYPQQEQGFGGMGMRIQNVGAGIEYLLVDNKHVFGAKLSYENTIAFFAGQIATDYLFTDTSKQIRVMPKIGLSLFGLVTLYYGWNIHLLKESELQTQNHMVSLQLNILK